MKTEQDKIQAEQDQIKGIVRFSPAYYSPHTQWVYWDNTLPITPDEQTLCHNNSFNLPGPTAPSICFVNDGCNCGLRGLINFEFSANQNQLELQVPFDEFLNMDNGLPALRLNQRITAVLTLETSGEYGEPPVWATDASWPIRGYILSPNPEVDKITLVNFVGGGIIGMVLGIFICGFAYYLHSLALKNKYSILN